MDYDLYVNPNDDTPYMSVPQSSGTTPLGPGATIDIRSEGPWGEVILRFRRISPTSHRCYLVAMSSDFTDGWLSKYSRSL